MQYLGGKTRIAKQLAEVIDRTRKPGQLVWDAFCGGLSMSVALSKNGPVWSTDVNAALINLYLAVQQGWVPPSEVSREQYAAAKLLPDTDPLKAFCGFGCSFGGLWFGSLVPPLRLHTVRSGPDQNKTKKIRQHAASARIVQRDVRGLRIDCVNFLACEPRPTDALLYLDPPYANTTGYAGVGAFCSQSFFIRAAHWALYTDVFISEYESPIGVCVWEKPMRTGQFAREKKTERLYHLPKGSKW